MIPQIQWVLAQPSEEESKMKYLDLLKKAQEQAPDAESAAAIQKLIDRDGSMQALDSGGGGHTDPDKPGH